MLGWGHKTNLPSSYHPWKSLGQSPTSWAIPGCDSGGSKTGGSVPERQFGCSHPVFGSNVSMDSTTLADLRALDLGLTFGTHRALKTLFPMGISLHCYGINI